MNRTTYRPDGALMRDLPSAPGSVDLRGLMRTVAQPVVVVTGRRGAGGEPVGLTVSSFTSVSLDPPLLLFCAGRGSRRWALIRESGLFAVNVLAAHQASTAARFASPTIGFPSGVPWEHGATGIPVLSGVLAVGECSTAAIHPSGDHDVVVGQVEHTDIGSGALPLAYSDGAYSSVHRQL